MGDNRAKVFCGNKTHAGKLLQGFDLNRPIGFLHVRILLPFKLLSTTILVFFQLP